jgi:Mor family transcriptional regulator
MAQEEMFDLKDSKGVDLTRHEARLVEMEHAWPKTLIELAEVFTAHFAERGLADEEAKREARSLVLTLAQYFGGRMWYVPRGDTLRNALRDLEIWHRFDGRNAQALAAEFRLSFVHVYRVIAEQRRLHREKTQHKLF